MRALDIKDPSPSPLCGLPSPHKGERASRPISHVEAACCLISNCGALSCGDGRQGRAAGAGGRWASAARTAMGTP